MRVRQTRFETIMTEKTGTGIGTVLNVKDFDNIMLSFGTTDSANCTVKFPGAIWTEPTFTNAASPTNHYAYIHRIDKTTGTGTSGATGKVLTGSDDNVLILVNIENIDYFTCHVTARSAGKITIKAKLAYDG